MTAVVLSARSTVLPAALARAIGGDRLVPALIASSVAGLLWFGAMWRFRHVLVLDAFVGRGDRGGGKPDPGPGPGTGPARV